MILILLASPLSIVLALLLAHPQPELWLWWLAGCSLSLAVFSRFYAPLRERGLFFRWLLVVSGKPLTVPTTR